MAFEDRWKRGANGDRQIFQVPDKAELDSVVATLQSQIDNLPVSNGTVEVDQTEVSLAYIGTSDIHNNGSVVDISSDDLSTNFTRSSNAISYTGTTADITITANIYAEDTGASSYWSRPSLRISNGSGVVGQFDDLGMQQNGSYSGSVQITGVVDIKGSDADTFTFEWFDGDNRTATLTPIPSSHIAIKATRKVEVQSA